MTEDEIIYQIKDIINYNKKQIFPDDEEDNIYVKDNKALERNFRFI